ncbi:hypothetical protein DH2020_022697 [Rehmannia glutinosa]|uniref:GBF-interacting protein 1 N-terminal domain-containing protein n=1 Tax=Rehmannia glutinosa TaxID=99300 RepID=A0ABR0W7N8_REHGL
MSSGVKGAAARDRVSISSSVKKTIENIKEITGQNHSEDEIYAMLKECSMDPNETAQKLILLDTFQEVKKKRDRRKELLSFGLLEVLLHYQNLNKEPAESRWNPDAGGGRHSSAVMQSSTSRISQKVVMDSPLANAQEMQKNEASSLESLSGVTSQSTNSICENHVSASGGVNQYNETGNTSKSKLEGSLLLSSSIDSSNNRAALARDVLQNEMLDSSNSAISPTSIPASGSHFSSLDPVLLPSQDVPLPSAVGTVGHKVGSKHTPGELIADNPWRKSASSVQQIPNDFQGVGKTRYVESVQSASCTIGISSVTRPSSNYENRSHVVGPQKVGPAEEWKPKSTTPSVGQGASIAASSEVSTISVRSHPESHPPPKEPTLELQMKLEKLYISNSQNVIIPNHVHVPDAGNLGFCFGSFDANFGLDMNQKGGLGSERSSLLSESYEANEEPAKELQLRCFYLLSQETKVMILRSSSAKEGIQRILGYTLLTSNHTVLAAAKDTETKYPDPTQSLSQGPEDFSSGDVEVSSSITPDYGESKQEVAPGSHQDLAVHTSSNYNYGFMPPILSAQLTPFESSESQARDVPQLPGFAVHQSFDPTSYYKQFYRSGMDSEGGISDLQSAVAANEFNGNAALISAQTSQSPQEVGASLAASPVPIVTQAAGVMQNSITATQQPLPVFRQPTGVHLPHYPPFIPYGPYFSPFYVPPPGIHQFLSNGAFHQQPQGGSLYPTPPGTIAKYSVSQFQQGSNTGSSTHIGVPGSYGPYGHSPANCTSSSVAAVTSTPNENLAAPQGKENNIYQSEGSGVCQGQLAFTPTHPGHGTFPGMFHPAPAVTAAMLHPLLQQSQSITIPGDMVGPTAGVYHHQQNAQLNWPTNF